MTRILAIEPDADRAERLQQFVHEKLHAELVLATSTDAAITALNDDRPDLILASTLLSANDDQDLVAHLRAMPSLGHIPVLTVPAVFDVPTPETAPHRLISRLFRRRQPTTLWPMFDVEAVAARIEEAIEQSKIAAAQADEAAMNAAVEQPLEPMPGTFEFVSTGDRERAPRLTKSDVPWLSSVRLPWGLTLRLLNLSSSGVLVESGVRLSPGSATSFRIIGRDLDCVVPARVVRSRVAAVDSLGVRYESAAVFDAPFGALAVAETEDSPADYADALADPLADLVAAVEERAASGAHPAQLRAQFETGILDLITAREVRIRDEPVVENDGRESIYFTIPTSDASCAVLQVTFETNDQPSAEEFELLTAAATAAAQVLPLTGTTRQTSVRANVHAVPASPGRVLSGHFAADLERVSA
jgi:CheY-like chemotaxis protein